MLPPTSQLPHIKSINATAFDKLQSSIDYLWKIYNPPVRGSIRRRRNTKQTFLSSSSSSSSALDVHDVKFERDYSMKWLTTLISHLGSGDADITTTTTQHENLINSAASLLAISAGTASAGTINRTFMFDITATTVFDDHDQPKGSPPPQKRVITIELEDVPLDNHDYRSVGAQTWGSACIMADMIAEDPPSFGIPYHHHHHRSPISFRCLELGAGTGLVSLTVAKILERHLHINNNSDSILDIEIIPSDYYPTVLSNLERNIRSNFTEPSPLHIHSKPLDWSIFSESNPTSDPAAIFQKAFDVIYGADIVYEAQHAEWIKDCLLKLLKKPEKNENENDEPAFHLIIPLRTTHTAESNTIERVFETRGDKKREDSSCNLIIKHKEVIICESETGSIEEVEYMYYRIGWIV